MYNIYVNLRHDSTNALHVYRALGSDFGLKSNSHSPMTKNNKAMQDWFFKAGKTRDSYPAGLTQKGTERQAIHFV